jgi:CD63 antigen
MRNFFVLCNILFAVAGVVIICFGTYLQVAAKDYLNFLGDKNVNTPIFVIILGGVIFVIALFGCCGACKKNKCLLNNYGVVLFVFLIAQIATGIAAFALKGYLKDKIAENMENGIKNYGAKGFEGFTTTWDLVQKELYCCGVQNYSDWKNVIQFADGGVPDSCCKGGEQMQDQYGYEMDLEVEGCGKGPVDSKNIFTLGCLSFFSEEFKRNFTIIVAIALGIAVGEMITICFACCFGRNYDYSYEFNC